VIDSTRRLIRDWIDGLGIDSELSNSELLWKLIDLIVLDIVDIGYENFADNVTADELEGGAVLAGRPLAGSSIEINVIPGTHPDDCRRVLLAVSRGAGRKGSLGFERIMQMVKQHLIRCGQITRLVVFLCDNWDTQSFEDLHSDELREWHLQGVRFIFLLVGSPRRQVSPVCVDLGSPR
jgi:hypothetical protein